MAKYKKGFSISELFSNSNGKTSGSGAAGFLTVTTGLAAFMAGVVFVYISCYKSCDPGAGSSIMTQAIALIGIGSALLGVRKVAPERNDSPNTEENESEER